MTEFRVSHRTSIALTIDVQASQPRIDRFALQCQNAENAFVDSAKWFVADEAFQAALDKLRNYLSPHADHLYYAER